MPIVPIDITIAGIIPDGDYIATVTRVEYQVKVGDKWNREGTQTCSSYDEWASSPLEARRLRYTLSIPERGNIWEDFYLVDKGLGFLKNFLQATNSPFNKNGFDPEAPIGKQIGIHIAVVEDEYGQKNQITKRWKI